MPRLVAKQRHAKYLSVAKVKIKGPRDLEGLCERMTSLRFVSSVLLIQLEQSADMTLLSK